jgi:NAD-dependent deacetylase
MHGQLFMSRCEACDRQPFEDRNLYEPPAKLPKCTGGGGIRPHIGEVQFELNRVYNALDGCTISFAVGTSGVVEPAASFPAKVRSHPHTIHVGPELPANDSCSQNRFWGMRGMRFRKMLGSFET